MVKEKSLGFCTLRHVDGNWTTSIYRRQDTLALATRQLQFTDNL